MSLKDKLQKLNESKQSSAIDWESRKTEWQKAVQTVLTEIKEWFKPYIESGLFQIVETEKSITEEYLGTYNTNQLEFQFNSFRLVFEPMGRNILGAMGRIDVYLRGRKTDKYVLILLETKDKEANWFLSTFKDKSVRIEFNKANTEKLIEDWIDENTI